MKRLRRWWRRLVGTFSGGLQDNELAQELESHLEMQIEANVRAGMSPREARRSALVAFRGIENVKESVRDQRGLLWLEGLWNAVRYGVRTLRNRPGFTIVAVLTLGLGIGATTAIFSVVYGVLIKPLPYPDAGELVSLRHTAPGLNLGLSADTLGSASSMYLTYRDENRTFDQVGLWSDRELTLTGLGEPARIRALAVTYGTLQALGVQPVLGRWFSDAEHTPGREGREPVILSYAFWQSRFGGDESALGRTLSLDSRPSQVVGIMPADFRFLNLTPQPDVISAVRIDGSRMMVWDTVNRVTLGNLNYNGLARLKDGVTLPEANADVARMLPIWLDAWPARPGAREAAAEWRLAPALRPLKDEVVGGVAAMLWPLMGTVGAVLLIACANFANLLLVRADERRQELTIRAAIGAGRRRIAGAILGESFVLGALGGVVGLALAYAGLKFLTVFVPSNLPRVEDIAIDLPVLAFSVASALVSSLLFGSIPAVKQAFGSKALPGSGPRGGSVSRERNRTRSALIVVQVALALMLLVGAGLMIRTFQALTAVDPGFTDPEHVQVARIFIPATVIREPERYTRVYRDILERISALPGVTAAGFGGGVPLEGRTMLGTISVEDRPRTAGEPPPRRFMSVSPRYFEALGTRLVAGRDIAWADIEHANNVALVSENLARELWGEPRAAIGKRIREAQSPTAPWREVIGVTQNIYEDGLYRRPATIVYLPVMMAGFDLRAITYAIRSDRAGAESLVHEVREAVWASNTDLPVFQVRTMQDIYSDSLAQTSFMLVLLALAGAMALLLSVAGIYGALSYVVSLRSREIGIRLALGARPWAVKRMFVLYGLAVAALGVIAGLAASSAFSRWMVSLLFEVQPLDPATYLAVLGLLLAAVTLAAYVPAQRATRVDPAETLRRE